MALRKSNFFLFILSLCASTLFSPSAQASDPAQIPAPPPTAVSAAELEELMKPVALYPDVLLQQILAACTFPNQVLEAAVYNEQGKQPEAIIFQRWDQSVKYLANYPGVISRLAAKLDWTIAVGSAFINQNKELRDSIQRLRRRAIELGNLKSSAKQSVIEEIAANGETIIRIEPGDPNMIYIPPEEDVLVYEQTGYSDDAWLPVASFGIGMMLGYGMDDQEEEFYGGYYGPGFWVSDEANDSWLDFREDRWEDIYDFKQERRENWSEYWQGLDESQKLLLAEMRQRRNDAPTPEQRAQRRTAESRVPARSVSESRSVISSERAPVQRAAASDVITAPSFQGGSFSKSAPANTYSPPPRAPQLRETSQNYARSDSAFDHRPAMVQGGPVAGIRESDRLQRANGNRGGGLAGLDSNRKATERVAQRGSNSINRAGAVRVSGGFRGGGGRR